jgi:hypothetical protein
MYDRSRLTRLITLALASCCVTWALAVVAQARPDSSASASTTATAAPAFQPSVGDTDKVPSASTAPAYQPATGDTLKTPDPSQVQRVLNGIGRGKAPGQPATVDANNNDDTGTIALIVAIVAMLTALAAMTMVSMRQTRPVMRA